MISRSNGISSPCRPIRITSAIHPFVVMSHNARDFGIVLDLRKNSLADDRVLFHLPSLIQRQRASLFEKAGWKPDLPNVVNQAAKMRHSLFRLGQAESLRDISRIDRHRS